MTHTGYKMENVIFKSGIYRIIEVLDEFWDMEDLQGDVFDPEVNPLGAEILSIGEKELEDKIYDIGVYGYVLQEWNSAVGCGWECIESCYGFVGQYSEKNNHYIVGEYKERVSAMTQSASDI